MKLQMMTGFDGGGCLVRGLRYHVMEMTTPDTGRTLASFAHEEDAVKWMSEHGNLDRGDRI